MSSDIVWVCQVMRGIRVDECVNRQTDRHTDIGELSQYANCTDHRFQLYKPRTFLLAIHNDVAFKDLFS